MNDNYKQISSNQMHDYFEMVNQIANHGHWNGQYYELGLCNLKTYAPGIRMKLCVPIAVYEKIDLAIQNMLIKHRIGFTVRYVEISLALNTTMQEIIELLVAFDEVADKDLKYRLWGKKSHFYKTDKSNIYIESLVSFEIEKEHSETYNPLLDAIHSLSIEMRAEKIM